MQCNEAARWHIHWQMQQFVTTDTQKNNRHHSASPPGQCHPVDPAWAWNLLLKGSAGGFWLFRICDLSKTSRTKDTTVSRYLRFQQSPVFRTRTFFVQDLFSRLTVLLRFDPCCMFVVSIIMDSDLIRIESYHSETLTLGATKTWAQLNHLNTSGYLIRIYLLICQ